MVLATAKVIPRPHVAAGSVPTTATAAGTAIPKAIRKRLAAAGKKDTARNVAMMTMSDRAVQAGETTNIEAVRGMMRIVVTKAGAAPMMRRPSLFFGRPRTWRLVGRPRGPF